MTSLTVININFKMFKLLATAALGLIATSSAIEIGAENELAVYNQAALEGELMAEEKQKRYEKRQIRYQRRALRRARRDQRRANKQARRSYRRSYSP